MKNALVSKTLWVSLIVALLPWLEQVKAALALDPKAQTFVTAIGILMMVLRFFTNQPLKFGK